MGDDDLGEINIQNFQSIIDKYERLVRDLTTELDTSKVEQSNLKLRITDLLDENKRLSNKTKDDKEDTGKGDEVKIQSDSAFGISDNTLIRNLRDQLDFVTKEKESIMGLWKDSLQTVDHLEEELKFYEGSVHGLVPKAEITKLRASYEMKLKALQNELGETKSKYDHMVAVKSQELDSRNQELLKAVDTQCSTFQIVKNLEEEIRKLQEHLKETQDTRSDLETELGLYTERIERLRKENLECQTKVVEAIQVVEAAFNEKDAALMREQIAKEEIEKLSTTLSEIIEEAGEKVKKEVEAVKKEFNDKLKVVLVDLKVAQNEVKSKELDIEKQVKEIVDLKKEIERIQNFSVTHEQTTLKFISLEKTLESTFQKLLLSEKRNIQLEAEKENLKTDLDQMGNHYQRDIKAREIEKVGLQNKIKSLQTELEETHSKFITMSEKMETLNQDIMNTEKEFKEQIAMKEDMMKTSYKQADRKNVDLLSEIQKHVECQMQMNQKWKSETKIIVHKLQSHIKVARDELNTVRNENKKLREKVYKANQKHRQYKKMLNMISKDINKVAENIIQDNSLFKQLPGKKDK